MKRKLILLNSMNFTTHQKLQLLEKYDINEFQHLPIELQKVWDNIAISSDSMKINITEIRLWLMDNSTHFDYMLVQGPDAGVNFYFVNWALKNKIIAIYSSGRIIETEAEINETSVFRNYF